MFKNFFAVFFTLTVALTLLPLSAIAQSTDRTMPMRTPDGQPDISGNFTFRTLTPFERPSQFEGQENLSAEAAAAFEGAERARVNRDLLDPERRAGVSTDRGQRAAWCRTTSSGSSGASS